MQIPQGIYVRLRTYTSLLKTLKMPASAPMEGGIIMEGCSRMSGGRIVGGRWIMIGLPYSFVQSKVSCHWFQEDRTIQCKGDAACSLSV
jgi:hypothetical protein